MEIQSQIGRLSAPLIDLDTFKGCIRSLWVLRILLCLIVVALSGCSSNLKIQEGTGGEATLLPGFPIPRNIDAIEYFALTSHSSSQTCLKIVNARRVHAPIGEIMYVYTDPKIFASTSLTIKLRADGGLQELAFNSAPSADAAEAAVTAASTLLPFVGILPDIQETAKESEENQEAMIAQPMCNLGDVSLKLVPAKKLHPTQIIDEARRLQAAIR